jgi:hypothetical protein
MRYAAMSSGPQKDELRLGSGFLQAVSRWRTRASSSFTGSEPGTTRIDSLARALGRRTLDEPATLVMSTPMAEMDGLAHNR